jgi:single-strand DNA-binding protein
MNRVILVGNLTHDPELRYTPSGKAVTAIRLATNEYAGQDDAGRAREHTEFHLINVWGAQAEAAAKHLEKGRQILVEGAIRTRSWDDQATSQRRYRTEILASRLEFLGGARNGHQAAQPVEPAVVPGTEAVHPDDIPF